MPSTEQSSGVMPSTGGTSDEVPTANPNLTMSLSSSVMSTSTSKDYKTHHPMVEQKPWLRCCLIAWEAFFCEGSANRLMSAKKISHDDEEWVNVYHACRAQGTEKDVRNLMRLIYAQTSMLNTNNNLYTFVRVGDTIEMRASKDANAYPIQQWRRNQDPHSPYMETREDFTPELPLGWLHVVECDSITIAMNVDQVKNVEDAHVTLVCSCTDHPGSDVLAGVLHLRFVSTV